VSGARRDLAREARIERAMARLDAIIRKHGDAAFRWLRLDDLIEEDPGAEPARAELTRRPS
jgi:hypothetical protein